MNKIVIYSHGKDSSPWGEKTHAFADVAQRHGFDFESPDYRTLPNPDERVEQLLSLELSRFDRIVLIGSSMGAYVSTVASPRLKPAALFLLAPAFYLPGYRHHEFRPTAGVTRVFHGWQDDIVPPENSWRFCRQHRIRLNMYDTDHRMLSALPLLTDAFGRLLATHNY